MLQSLQWLQRQWKRGGWETSSSSSSVLEELSWRDGVCAPRLWPIIGIIRCPVNLSEQQQWTCKVFVLCVLRLSSSIIPYLQNVDIWSAIFRSANFISPIFCTIWFVTSGLPFSAPLSYPVMFSWNWLLLITSKYEWKRRHWESHWFKGQSQPVRTK